MKSTVVHIFRSSFLYSNIFYFFHFLKVGDIFGQIGMSVEQKKRKRTASAICVGKLNYFFLRFFFVFGFL